MGVALTPDGNVDVIITYRKADTLLKSTADGQLDGQICDL